MIGSRMKYNLLLLIAFLGFSTISFGQKRPSGAYLFCSDSLDCTENEAAVYMFFGDSTISYMAVIQNGLDPMLLAESTYWIEDEILTIQEKTPNGNVLDQKVKMHWLSEEKLQLIDLKSGESFYLLLLK